MIVCEIKKADVCKNNNSIWNIDKNGDFNGMKKSKVRNKTGNNIINNNKNMVNK
jgi:hypothetical protein